MKYQYFLRKFQKLTEEHQKYKQMFENIDNMIEERYHAPNLAIKWRRRIEASTSSRRSWRIQRKGTMFSRKISIVSAKARRKPKGNYRDSSPSSRRSRETTLSFNARRQKLTSPSNVQNRQRNEQKSIRRCSRSEATKRLARQKAWRSRRSPWKSWQLTLQVMLITRSRSNCNWSTK